MDNRREWIALFVGFVAIAAIAENAVTPDPLAQKSVVEAENAPLPEVVARVGDETITSAEFRHDLEYRLRQERRIQGGAFTADAQFRRKTLDELIGGRILRILARNSGTTVTEEEISREFERGMAILGPKPEALQQYLEREELTLAELREQIRTRLLVEKFVAEKTKEVVVTEEEMKARYGEWDLQGWTRRASPTADFAHIVTEVSEESDGEDKARNRVEAARARIMAGEDFAEVAREVSDDENSASKGGIYYEAAKGSLPEEMEQRIWELPIGEVSEPFRSPAGWHILKTLARNAPGRISYDTLREQLRDTLYREKQHDIINELVDSAKNVINIEIMKAPLDSDAKPASVGGSNE